MSEQDEIEQKRAAIRQVYWKSATWQFKVDKMSNQQVLAIYLRFRTQGKIK